MKARLLAGMTIAGVFGVATASWAGPPPTLIAVEDDQFAPGKAIQLLESSTTWSWADDVVHEHNVREDHKLFRSGPLTSDPTAMATETISVGTFHYYCEKHGSKSGGMDGKVKVSRCSSHR